MLSRAPIIDTRPARGRSQSDLIAGNEFLKLFLERDEVQRSLHSGEYEDTGDGDGDVDGEKTSAAVAAGSDSGRELAMNASSRSTSARSLDYKARSGNGNSNLEDGAGKQVVKLVTTGSKIVFLEEYDDDDAIVDAVAREIDLQKEKTTASPVRKLQQQQQQPEQQLQLSRQQRPQPLKTALSDEVKVVAVSVSSSSKRGSSTRTRSYTGSESKQKQTSAQQQSHDIRKVLAAQNTPSVVQPTTTHSTSMAMSKGDFINRSHKSEFSIEEAEPLTMQPQQKHKTRAGIPFAAALTQLVDGDSQNSASSNIHNILAAPLMQTDVPHSGLGAAAMTKAAYHSRNATSLNQAGHINHTPSPTPPRSAAATMQQQFDAPDTTASHTPAGGEDKLLPFQTVIYHDTKEGHGPQSRSISYSSISQNVDDLHAWQQAAGILAEAQRNVSESLKPLQSRTKTHTPSQELSESKPQSQPKPSTHFSEPAKFYSVPAKMYGVPSKFYSEPAKVYSEPAKVYGQPEKFYSEPAKVYSQPSKFYSEPAKVYSQPAKVYSEPSKNYWPTAISTTTTTQATFTNISSTKPTTTTTTSAPKYPQSRRPAIVSRIAFGEAQTSTSIPTNFEPQATAPKSSSSSNSNTFQHPNHHNHHHQHLHHRPPTHGFQHSHGNLPSSQPRRVLFNLDKLPYDLLNAPEQSSKPLLEPDLSKSPLPSAAISATFAATHHQQQSSRPCLESTFSSTLTTSQHQLEQQQQQQQQRHSSLSSDQHSNQNAKGLSNRDLVKCVTQFSQPQHQTHHFTTESSRHNEELYTPTPEQNYEIEESVSVMTNGRAHGVQGGVGALSTTTTVAPAAAGRWPTTRSRIRFGERAGAGGIVGGTLLRGGTVAMLPQLHYNAKTANANVAAGAGVVNENGNDAGVGGADHGERNNNYNNNYDNEEDDVDAVVVDTGGRHKGHSAVGGGDGDGDVDNDRGDDDDDDDDSKVAYVVEGRNYRKYRVEEKTDDGFIVGEYGVVDHNDGNLRGVRYTADSTINRSLIQKALLTFLKLK